MVASLPPSLTLVQGAPWGGVVLTFLRFDLEADHDVLCVGPTVMGVGGTWCSSGVRETPFTLHLAEEDQSGNDIALNFTSDSSVARSGFLIRYSHLDYAGENGGNGGMNRWAGRREWWRRQERECCIVQSVTT
jgi:hypothetical protein